MSRQEPDLESLASGTPGVYERHAAEFDAQRPKRLHERIWLERFAERLPEGAKILDLGCGTGEPFARWFTGRGFRVTGVDIAGAMLDIARQRFPDGDWRRADMRSLDLGERFDGIIAWHSFFHLTREEQRSTLPRLADHLVPGGVMLLTVGPDDGEVVGHVAGAPVYHASLSPAEYEALLQDLGMTVLAFVMEDPECDLNTLLLAAKTEAQA